MPKADKDIVVENAAWNFNDVADSFDDHVVKSVPLYNEGHELICQLSDFFLPTDATVTEIGVSTGALAKKFMEHNKSRKDISYQGIDCVPAILEKAKERCGDDPRITFINEDILSYDIEKSSIIISYYTMQFIPPRSRQAVINKIYESLEWGGAFMLFEKVRAPDARFQDIAMQIYHEYKLKQEFTEEEILGKQRSLKGVLEPFSTQGNIDMLKRAGFEDVMTVMKWVCFEGFVAIK